MKKTYFFVTFILMLAGCMGGMGGTTVTKSEKPLVLQATKSYLPGGVMNQPAYTIYEDSIWDCKNKTEKNEYVCCSRESFSSMSPWKYCLLVDGEYNAFAYFEPGANQYRNWPEGRQPIFRKSDE